MKWLVLLLLAACSSGRDFCVTKRGLRLGGGLADAGARSVSLPKEWTCEAFQRAEDKAWRFFEPVTDPRFRNEKALEGWTVYVMDTRGWYVPQYDQPIAGITYCERAQLHVGNGPVDRYALFHEMAHGIQRCCPQDDCFRIPYVKDELQDWAHANWTHIGLVKQQDLWELE